MPAKSMRLVVEGERFRLMRTKTQGTTSFEKVAVAFEYASAMHLTTIVVEDRTLARLSKYDLNTLFFSLWITADTKSKINRLLMQEAR